MTDSVDLEEDRKKFKPDGILSWRGALGYLERRAERIIESRQAINRIAGAIRETMLDISNLFARTPSVNGQAALDRSVGNLQGLARAAEQASSAIPFGGVDSGASPGADINLTGIKAAVDARRESTNTKTDSASEGGLQNPEGKTRRHSAEAKALSKLDAAVGSDAPTPRSSEGDVSSDEKPPLSDAPASKADRFKSAFAHGDDNVDPASPPSAERPPLPEQPSARLSPASLKLDHAEAMQVDPPGTAAAAPGKTIKPMPTGQDAMHLAVALANRVSRPGPSG